MVKATTTAKTPARGDIWHVSLDPVSGHELMGPHYFIVITDEALNRKLKVAMCCPISTGASAARSAGVTVSIRADDTANGKLSGVVLCHQLKAADLIARGAKYYTKADDNLVTEVTMKLVDLIDPQ